MTSGHHSNASKAINGLMLSCLLNICTWQKSPLQYCPAQKIGSRLGTDLLDPVRCFPLIVHVITFIILLYFCQLAAECKYHNYVSQLFLILFLLSCLHVGEEGSR